MSAATTHLMRSYARQNVAFERGAGTRLWDGNGREYLDAISGVAVTSLGHAHPEIAAVIADQAARLMHTSNMFGIGWQECLGARLCALADMQRAFFCNSGAEANETALKLALLHGRRKGIERPLVIVMHNSFHGRTLATLSASGNPAVQAGYEPLVQGFVRAPYGDIDAVRRLARANPGIVAVLVEPVQGEGGVHVASPEYLRALRVLCTQEDWLLMADEVQTGIGRTGAWFGYRHAGVLPDVVTLAKALGNGFPIGACLARGPAAGLFSPGQHGSTFGGNPLACRVGCAVLDVMENEGLVERAGVLGRRMLEDLRRALGDWPGVRAVRGHGLMLGIELDRPCGELVARALDQEALLITVTRERVIRLLPPLVTSDADADTMVARLVRLVRAWSNEQHAPQAQDSARRVA